MRPYPHLKSPPEAEGDWFAALTDLARYLRGPEGCPWDRKQSARNFAEFLLEETRELIEALEKNDDDNAEEEFGDVLFCLLACGAGAEAEDRFQVKRALERIHEKMIRRHDHVFGENKAATPEEAVDAWNKIKAAEKQAK